MTRFPITRLALARLLVLLAMRLLPADSWAFERLWWVNDSLKRQAQLLRGEA